MSSQAQRSGKAPLRRKTHRLGREKWSQSGEEGGGGGGEVKSSIPEHGRTVKVLSCARGQAWPELIPTGKWKR